MPLPPGVSQWWHVIQANCGTVNPYTVAAVMDRETQGGLSGALDIMGPSGTGDHTPRRGHHFASSTRYREVTPGAFMPADARGWGRGLMQIDYEWEPDFCDQPGTLWADPQANILKGSTKLEHGILRFGTDIPGVCPDPEMASIASYNAGEGNVHHALHGLPSPIDIQVMIRALDALTTGKNYLTDVLRRRSEMMQDVTAPPSVG